MKSRICHNCNHPVSSHVSCKCPLHEELMHCKLCSCTIKAVGWQYVRVKVDDGLA